MCTEPKTKPTEFAPAELAPDAELQRHISYFANLGMTEELISAVPNFLMVVNRYRQIVYANSAMVDYLGLDDRSELLAIRPGEALQCSHAFEGENSCGTTAHCRYCGAIQAVLTAQEGKRAVQECRIIRRSGVTPPVLNLRIWTIPWTVGDDDFVIVAATDISDEKRRQALERTFFHDLLNLAGVISHGSELMLDLKPEEYPQVLSIVNNASRRLVDEIQAQRQLAALEHGDFVVTPETLQTTAFLRSLLDIWETHDVARGRKLQLAPTTDDLAVVIDRTLLERVLGNMIKNALEAEPKGSTITVGCSRMDAQTVEFWVHNPSTMPESVKMQVFQRAFSTKGEGRGLGTYSMKLLTEDYLEGEVTFTSRDGQGTTFRVCYPIEPTYADEQSALPLHLPARHDP
ncbi:MAG: sensor histidine kinase [Anaerolineae bacterium]